MRDQDPPGASLQNIILEHELSEVLLLLDHVSSVKAKALPTVLINDPIFKDQTESNWIEQVCEIAYPPSTADDLRDIAHDAAKLLRAKDVLNGVAEPATGESIAFTVMMTGEANQGLRPPWWVRLARALGIGQSHHSNAADNDPVRHRSRGDLAVRAYPNLAHSVRFYRGLLYALLAILLVFLGLTCLLSWDVATGSALLNRYNTLELRIVDPNKAKLPNLTTPPPSTPGATATPAAIPTPTPSPTATPTVQARQTPVPTPAATSVTTPGSAANRAEKDDIARALQQQELAAANLRKWLEEEGGIRSILIDRMGGGSQIAPPDPKESSADRVQRNNDYVEWAAIALGILAGTILPIFYGLIGAGAATVRIVSAKMRDSTLLPRDVVLAYVRLALGAVIGACISLFVSPDGTPQGQGGLLGPVHLSASALCFVAGFGVEGVFQALEELVRRVFNLNAPASSTAVPTVVPMLPTAALPSAPPATLSQGPGN